MVITPRAVTRLIKQTFSAIRTDVSQGGDDDPIIAGKIALAHMKEFPDYYERLERMEREAERDWAEKQP